MPTDVNGEVRDEATVNDGAEINGAPKEPDGSGDVVNDAGKDADTKDKKPAIPKEIRADFFKAKKRAEQVEKERDAVLEALNKTNQTMEQMMAALKNLGVANPDNAKGDVEPDGGDAPDDFWASIIADASKDADTKDGEPVTEIDAEQLDQIIAQRVQEAVEAQSKQVTKEIAVSRDLERLKDVIGIVAGDKEEDQARLIAGVKKLALEKDLPASQALLVLGGDKVIEAAAATGFEKGKEAAVKEIKVQAAQRGADLVALGIEEPAADPAIQRGIEMAEDLVSRLERGEID